MDWNHKLKQLMGEATQLVRTGHLADATRAIQQALGQPATAPAAAQGTGTPNEHAPSTAVEQPPVPGASFRTAAPWRTGVAPDVEDAVVIERDTRPGEGSAATDHAGHAGHQNAGTGQASPATATSPSATPSAAPFAAPSGPAKAARAGNAPSAEAPGSFTRVVFTQPGAPHTPHHYHLYVPPGAAAGTPMPLVLMLHGCTQNPTDFATGTGMNSAAAPANALVLYPAQPNSANPNGCWNWFRPEDQRRGSGEPALLMAMVRDVMARHPVDAQRVYVAGLSAGGAMAALLGREYPDVFAAVGVHSGLQAGAAHNVMGALSAMKTGAKPHPRGNPVAAPGQPVTPVIVFHGDADATVSARNGEQVVEAALGAVAGGAAVLHKTVQQGQSGSGQRYTRAVHRRAEAAGGESVNAGPVVAEHWVLHGAGHAWAGGNAQGSHTDPRGVDATGEMLRFFLEQRLAAQG
ncbi:extracellular catalytic domain type 1 short-chain-length polyhydroxyalkanoate depolymerase [Acidovorax sp. LjRoot194]|uniref:extracellular catalytic domain type 1 short-chain-length polyhydroxyalkanoate depolymerase n=1 Tax=Acidovorax sp. LjRoot194 TaxID=3342280 RepID=UPI003ED08A03